MKATAKDRLADALIRLMRKQDISMIRVKDLILEAGINSSSFYYNFDSISDVARYVISKFTDRFTRSLAHADYNNPGSMIEIYDYIYDNRDIYQVLHKSVFSAALSSEITNLFIDLTGAYEYYFRTEEGEIFRLNVRDEKIYVELIARQETDLINFWADHDFEFSPEEIVDIEVGMFLLQYAYAVPKKDILVKETIPERSLSDVILVSKKPAKPADHG